MDSKEAIILFDGVCNLCNSSVQFIIKHDKKGYYKFAALQSEKGQELLKTINIKADYLDSMILFKNNKYHLKSDAVLNIAKNLDGFLKIAYLFIFLPRKLRNYFYDNIAKNRYTWFGKKEICMMPSADILKRFLDS